MALGGGPVVFLDLFNVQGRKLRGLTNLFLLWVGLVDLSWFALRLH